MNIVDVVFILFFVTLAGGIAIMTAYSRGFANGVGSQLAALNDKQQEIDRLEVDLKFAKDRIRYVIKDIRRNADSWED